MSFERDSTKNNARSMPLLFRKLKVARLSTSAWMVKDITFYIADRWPECKTPFLNPLKLFEKSLFSPAPNDVGSDCAAASANQEPLPLPEANLGERKVYLLSQA